MKTKNYFVWIANLGVVPLFLFCAFLFAPVFFVLFALFASVAFVRDAIIVLLHKIQCDSQRFLLRMVPSVNAILVCCIILPNLGLHALEKEPIDLVLSSGEYNEIPIKSLHKFTIGNKEIISDKYLKSKGVFMVKGKKLGFTELIIWQTAKQKEVYRIYVINKQKELEILYLVEMMKKMGLQTSLLGTIIKVSGEITSLSNLRLLHTLIQANQKKLFIHVSISQKLLFYMIGEIYYYLFNEGLESVACKGRGLFIECEHPYMQKPAEITAKRLMDEFFVKFVPVVQSEAKNYKIKFKLLQVEKLDGSEIRLGLDQLSITPAEIFNKGMQGWLVNNQIHLNNKNLDFSTLAEPEGLLQLGTPFEIQVGSEIPYITNKEEATTEWKFAGIKLIVTAISERGQIRLTFNTEFTGPSGSNVQGSKQSSSVITTTNSPIELFQIGYRSIGEEDSSFPLLSKIPLAGALFKSKSKQSNYKKISCLVIINEE